MRDEVCALPIVAARESLSRIYGRHVIGEEWAGRLGPLSGVRVVSPWDRNECVICGHVNAACTHETERQAREVQAQRIDVEALVMARVQQQRRVDVPPVKPAVAAPAPPLVAPVTDGVTGATAVPVPETPLGPTMTQPVGFGPGAQTLSPVAAGVATVPQVEIPEGDPTTVRDIFVVPDGMLSPDDDENRPPRDSCVLVNDANDIIAAGCWMTLPGGNTIALTKDVRRVWWAMGSAKPNYSQVGAQGAVLPKPGVPR